MTEVRIWNKNERMFYMAPKAIFFDGEPCAISYLTNLGDEITVDINDVVIEQFTGLLDKNNKKIFEGDIVKTEAKRYRYGSNHWENNGKYDKIYTIYGTIVFQKYRWRIDWNNPFNNRILELKGKEKEERRFYIEEDLHEFDNNVYYKLEIVGNICHNNLF